MISRSSLTGVILAGGQSRRMQPGGPADTDARGAAGMRGRQAHSSTEERVDKGLLDLHGKPLIAHAHDFLAPWVEFVLISANRHLEHYQRYGRVIADAVPQGEYLGPLAGVARALALAATPWVMVMPVDVVNIPADLIVRLSLAAQRNAVPLAYATCQSQPVDGEQAQPGGASRVQPLCMVAHVSLAADLRAYLAAGDRKVQLWQQRSGAVPVFFEGGDDTFMNINTPEDLLRARRFVHRAE